MPNPFSKYAPQSGAVYGPPPKQPSQAEGERLDIDRQRLGISQGAEERQRQKDAAEQEEKQAKLTQTHQDAVDEMRRVIGQIDQVKKDASDNGGWFETGRSGNFVRSMPSWISSGSAALDLQKQIDMIDANTALMALQRMRENSPTGGAMGNVSDRDMALLKSKFASLDPNLGQEDFLRNLKQARDAYAQMLKRLEPADKGRHPADIEAIMKKYGQ